MSITPIMIGTDEDLAREVLVIARSIAPCISTFPAESEEQKDAIAILKRVYTECTKRGMRSVKSQRVGSAAVEYNVSSVFDGDPRTALRALCTASQKAGQPVGSFPAERPVGRVWPETYE